MFGKSVLAIALIVSVLSLSSCAADNEQTTEQSKTISSLQSQNRSLKQELSEIQEIKKGETVELSGIVRVGQTISPGYYTIKLINDKEEFFLFYEDNEAFEKHESKNELLTPDTDGTKTDIRYNYKLDKGNLLEIQEPLSFTRTGYRIV